MTATRPSINFMRAIIVAYHEQPGNIAGGSLHIVLDDGNIEAEQIEFCREFARERGDGNGVLLANLLLTFTQEERAAILHAAP